MSTQSILSWVACVTSNLRPSQSSTLAVLVAAAIRTERPNLATVGRRLAGPITAKSAIKRAWRFTCNPRIEVADAMAEVIAKLVRKRKKRLLVSFDWTEFRDFHTLMAAACIKGRSVPLLWASYPEWKLLRSQNSLEEGLLRLLRTLIPESIRVVILADRGFGRAEWAAVCQDLSFDYLVRIKPNVTVACKRYRGVLRNYPVKKGIAHVLHDVQYRKDARVTHHVVIRWRPNLPKKRDEPWYLMTNLEGRAEALCQLYGCRMQVEISRPHYDRNDTLYQLGRPSYGRGFGATGSGTLVPQAAGTDSWRTPMFDARTRRGPPVPRDGWESDHQATPLDSPVTRPAAAGDPGPGSHPGSSPATAGTAGGQA